MRLSLRMVALVVLASASTASAQAPTPATGPSPARHPFSVTPRAGYIAFDKASGIGNGAALGLDATYNGTSMLGITAAATFSRPETRGEDFIGAMYLGDTTFLYRAQQPITLADVTIGATVQLPIATRLAPYLHGGIGGYTLYLDPQASGQNNRVQKMSATVGGGLGYRLSDRVGVSLDVRDLIFMHYDRSRLNPVRPAARETRFIQDFPTAPAAKSTVHNLAFQIGFSFVPGADRDTPEETR